MPIVSKKPSVTWLRLMPRSFSGHWAGPWTAILTPRYQSRANRLDVRTGDRRLDRGKDGIAIMEEVSGRVVVRERVA